MQEPLATLDGNSTVLIALTHAQTGSNWYQNLKFWYHTFRVIRSLKSNPGYVGHQVRGNPLTGEAWTMTAWRNESALEGFSRSPTHVTAIRRGMKGLVRAEFSRLKRPFRDWPIQWSEAESLIQSVGHNRIDQYKVRNR